MYRQIPLIFNDPGYHEGLDMEHLCLGYRVVPTDALQRRFRNKLMAAPTIDLSTYEFRAVFDWIEILVETEKKEVAVNLQSWLMKMNREHGAFRSCFVTGAQRDVRSFGRVHVIKMQDPQPAGLRSLLRGFLLEKCRAWAKLSDIRVTGLELSLDVYPCPRVYSGAAYRVARMQMTELLRKHVSVNEVYRKGLRRPRFVFAKGGGSSKPEYLLQSPRRLARLASLDGKGTGLSAADLAARFAVYHRQPFIDATFYHGRRGERLHYRCMDKVTDNRSGADADDLPLEQTRSRLELTFIDEVPGDGLGPATVDIRSVGDIAPFGLRRFNVMLLFELPVFAVDAGNPEVPDEEEWKIFSKTGVGGLCHKLSSDASYHRDRAALRAKHRQESISSGTLLRYRDFNRRVSKALVRLERRWMRG